MLAPVRSVLTSGCKAAGQAGGAAWCMSGWLQARGAVGADQVAGRQCSVQVQVSQTRRCSWRQGSGQGEERQRTCKEATHQRMHMNKQVVRQCIWRHADRQAGVLAAPSARPGGMDGMTVHLQTSRGRCISKAGRRWPCCGEGGPQGFIPLRSATMLSARSARPPSPPGRLGGAQRQCSGSRMGTHIFVHDPLCLSR